MASEQNPPKKGPHRMATASNPRSPERISDSEIDATIQRFAEKANRVIQEARSKMTQEERERADRNAEAILEAASAAAKEAQRRA